MADAQVGVVINATDNASATLGKIGNAVKSLDPAFKAAAVSAGVAFAAVSAAIYTSIDAANEAAQVQAQLGAVLKSTAGVAGVTADAAISLSKALEGTTAFSDETVLSAENLLLTFTSIGKDIFPQATQTVLDMAQALGEDTSSAAIQLGKALQDPILGVTALRRVGVNFNQAQIDVIKNLVDTGKSAQAQQLILAELGKEFGGSAAANVTTFAGKLAQAKNQFNDMQEEIGNALLPAMASFLNAITPIISKLTEWASAHPHLVAGILLVAAATFGLITLIATLGVVLAGLVPAATALGISLVALLGWMVLIPLAIAAVIAIGYLLITHWSEISTAAQEAWAGIVAYIEEAWDAIKGAFVAAGAYLMGLWTGFTSALSAAWEAVWNVIQTIVVDYIALVLGIIITALNFFIPNWQQYLLQIYTAISTTFNDIYNFVLGVWNATIDAVSNAMLVAGTFIMAQFNTLKTAITAVLGAISSVWQSVWQSIADFFGGIWDSIVSKVQAAVDFIAAQIARLQSLIAPVSGVLGAIGSGVSGAFNAVLNTGKTALGVHDGVIQGGQIISTDPEDTIIAMKDPSSLGGGKAINISISGAILTQDAARTIGDMILGELRLQYKL